VRFVDQRGESFAQTLSRAASSGTQSPHGLGLGHGLFPSNRGYSRSRNEPSRPRSLTLNELGGAHKAERLGSTVVFARSPILMRCDPFAAPRPDSGNARERTSGYRRLAILLRREGKGMNLKKVYRLYREERLTVRKRGGRKRALGTRAPMAIPQEPNQRWSLDFVSDALACGRRSACSTSSTIIAGNAWRASSIPRCQAGVSCASCPPLPSDAGCRAWWSATTDRTDQSCCPRLVPGHRRGVALHRSRQAAAERLC